MPDVDNVSYSTFVLEKTDAAKRSFAVLFC